MNTKDASALIDGLSSQIDELYYEDANELRKFKLSARMVIARVFGESSHYIEDFESIEFLPRADRGPFMGAEKLEVWDQGKDQLQHLLRLMKADLDLDAAAEPTEDLSDTSRNSFGNWVIVRPLSEGGQSETYLVKESGTNSEQLYVLKKLKHPEKLHRFEGEVKACQALTHENIVRLVDFAPDGQTPYLVTEYCEGGTLSALPMETHPLATRLQMFAAICRGVAHAHTKGIVHRDIKPDNIFLRKDFRTPVVGDFGICYYDTGGERYTLVNEPVGPRMYIAPELEDGRADAVKPASDTYSLGKLLYWMLTGRIFAREKHRELQYDLTKDNSDPSFYLIYELLDQLIVADPSKRIGDANELLKHFDILVKRIELRAHAIDLNAPQLCTYCGTGKYRRVVNADTLQSPGSADISNFGLNIVGAPFWLIMVCSHCGHVQMFRPDHAEDRNAWKKQN
ncbi:MAG: serine/threonine-protein kinase [Verrucomicrobiia bacterium]